MGRVSSMGRRYTVISAQIPSEPRNLQSQLCSRFGNAVDVTWLTNNLYNIRFRKGQLLQCPVREFVSEWGGEVTNCVY